MSLKNASEIADKGTLPVSSWSITGRLTFLYTVSAAVLLLAATLFLYQALRRNLEREDRHFLSDKMRILAAALKQEGPKSEDQIVDEISWEGTIRQFNIYYVRILDKDGNVLIETPHMADLLPSSVFATPSEGTEDGKVLQWTSANGDDFLLISTQVKKERSGTIRILQAALNVSKNQSLLFHYRRDMVIVFLFGILFSAGAGVLVARKGMEPLADITTAAQRITPSQLHERIAPENWPKELVQLAVAFDHMLERLENSFTRLSQFSADLAHELRTPINTLIGEAEVALSKERGAEEYRQVLESSLEEYASLSRLIDNLLFLARAESPEMRIEKTKFDPGAEARKVKEFHDVLASERGVKISCDGSAVLNANPTLFRRAVSNLVSNALRYTPKGGEVVIHVRQQEDQGVEVSVADTGAGIDPKHLPRIFDRFYRADPVRGHDSQEMGLGLSIVKSIVDLHGGTTAIQSELTKGTTITLHFPPAAN